MAILKDGKVYPSLHALLSELSLKATDVVEYTKLKSIFPIKDSNEIYEFEGGKLNVEALTYEYGVNSPPVAYAVLSETYPQYVVDIVSYSALGSTPLYPDDDVKLGDIFDPSINDFTRPVLTKQEAMLKGFEWTRGEDTYNLSVTQQDSITLLVECKAQFELQMMNGVEPKVEKVIFANGTVVENVSPADVQSIMLQASAVRSEIEVRFE